MTGAGSGWNVEIWGRGLSSGMQGAGPVLRGGASVERWGVGPERWNVEGRGAHTCVHSVGVSRVVRLHAGVHRELAPLQLPGPWETSHGGRAVRPCALCSAQP